jgi:hypothetical protein
MTTGRFLEPESIEGSSSDGETIATVDGVPAWVPMSIPVLLLPSGSDASDVPAGTPVGTIIFMKA